MKDVVVIVDPFSTGTLYAPEFHKRGYQTLAVLSSDEISKRWTKAFTPSHFIDSKLYSVAEALNTKYISRVCAVVAGCESAVEVTDILSNKLGLHGNKSSTSQHRRNKLAMQQRLANENLANINSILLHRNEAFDLTKHGCLIDHDYVVKPISSVCSNGVSFVSGDKLPEFVESLDWDMINDLGVKNSGFIVQNFIQGTEYVVDLVTQHGNISVCSICRYKKIPANGAQFVYSEIEILDIHDDSYAHIISYAIQCTRALGIENGPAHMEIMLTENGPVMIEVGARLHGGVAPSLFIECYQPNLLDVAVESYVGSINPEFSKKISNGKIILIINKEGDVLSARGATKLSTDLSNIDSFQGFKPLAPLDTKLPATIDLATCPGIVWLSNKDPQKLESDLSLCHELISKIFGSQ